MGWFPAFIIGFIATICLLPLTTSIGGKDYRTWPPHSLAYALTQQASPDEARLPSTLEQMAKDMEPDWGRLLEPPPGLFDWAGLEDWLYWPESGPTVARNRDTLVLLGKRPLHYYRSRLKPYYPAVVRSDVTNFTVVRLREADLVIAGVIGLVDTRAVRVPRWTAEHTFGAIGRWIMRLGLLGAAGSFLWFQILLPLHRGFSQEKPMPCAQHRLHGSWIGMLLFGGVVLSYWNVDHLPGAVIFAALVFGIPAAFAFGLSAVSKGPLWNQLGGVTMVLLMIALAGLLVFSSERSRWLFEWW